MCINENSECELDERTCFDVEGAIRTRECDDPNKNRVNRIPDKIRIDITGWALGIGKFHDRMGRRD